MVKTKSETLVETTQRREKNRACMSKTRNQRLYKHKSMIKHAKPINERNCDRYYTKTREKPRICSINLTHHWAEGYVLYEL
jgi:hypothetical protein